MSGLGNGGNGSGKSSAPRPRGKLREKSGIGFEVFIFLIPLTFIKRVILLAYSQYRIVCDLIYVQVYTVAQTV